MTLTALVRSTQDAAMSVVRQGIGELTGTHTAPTAGVADGVLRVGALVANASVVIYERRRGRGAGAWHGGGNRARGTRLTSNLPRISHLRVS